MILDWVITILVVPRGTGNVIVKRFETAQALTTDRVEHGSTIAVHNKGR